MVFKRLIVWLMAQAFLIVQTAAVAQTSHDQGAAAGTAANTAIKAMVNQPSASSVVPGYTTAPAQTSLYGAPNLPAQASAQLQACALSPNDAVCQAQLTAVRSANTPRPAVGPYDPSVATAHRAEEGVL